MDIPIDLILFYGSAFAFAFILAFCIILIAVSSTYPLVYRSKSEENYVDPKTEESHKFPSINDKFSINLSVIIPAFNEETRLPLMLDECLEYLENLEDKGLSYEVIVVSDGSSDGTVKVANKYCKKYGVDKFRILDLEINRGKGGAIRLGMQSARGALLLFADADGATKFADLKKLETSLTELIGVDFIKNPEKASEQLGIAIGSRAHLEKEAVASRTLFRTILMFGFHFLVWFFAVKGIKDTQCGFKLMTRKTARICFGSLHVERWAFDVELLYIAQKLKIPIAEVAVNWTEIEGSKLVPFWSWVQMGRDLFLIWLRYLIGAWKIKYTKTE